MDGFRQDLRFSWRAIRRAPVFSAIAVGCLAVAIAVNAAAFSVLDALLVRDLPGIRRQGELSAVLLSFATEGGMRSPAPVSTLDWERFRNRIPGFSASGVMGNAPVALRMKRGALAVRADFVSGGFFGMLGTQPVAGRLLTEYDDRPGAPPVAVISHSLWESEFSRDPAAIGKPVHVAGNAFTVVGVAPPGYVGLYPGELVADPVFGAPYLILPLSSAPLVRAASRYTTPAAALDDEWLALVGRRRPGVSESEIATQARAVAASLAAEYPRERAQATAFARLPNTASKTELIAGVAFTMAIPLLILLVACANLANQLLARAVQRGREIAVRLALGATRRRLVRLLLVESSLLAIAASVLGVLIARGLTDMLGTFALVLPFRIPIDLRVVLFTIALASVTAVAFGLLPALRATRIDLAEQMKEGPSGGGYRRSRLRGALVVTQVAASVALLALAGVFARGSRNARISDTAHNSDRVLTVAVDLDLLRYDTIAGRAFQATAVERLRALPGVEAVATAPYDPASSIPAERVSLPGDPPERVRYRETVRARGDWFAVQAARPLAGRLFTAEEARSGAPVAVVDEALARRYWPDEMAVGKALRIGEGKRAEVVTVVGVIPTIRDRHGHNDDGVVTTPASAGYDSRTRFWVRARGNAADLRASARDVVRAIDTKLPPPKVETLGESLDEIAVGVKQMAAGVAAMGTVALLLAALGLAGVLSFIVEQRRHEIGVRMALGAPSSAVTWMVVRQSLSLAAIGIAVGSVVAGLAATLLRGMLFGLPPLDPAAFAVSIGVIVAVTLLASAAPARRAAKVDPMVALRAE